MHLPSFEIFNENSDSQINKEFLGLVGGLFDGGSLLNKEVIKAVESNDVEAYMEKYKISGGDALEAIHCLVSIYDELENDNPDESLLNELVGRFEEYQTI